MIFWDRKSQNRFFFNFFISKSPNFISNLNEDCSQLSFEVYNVCVAQNLRISEFLIEFFFAWTLATSATSRGRNFNLSNLNRVSNFSSRPKLSYETLFVAQKWNWEELDYVFSIRAESAPPRVSRRPKSPGLLGLICKKNIFHDRSWCDLTTYLLLQLSSYVLYLSEPNIYLLLYTLFIMPQFHHQPPRTSDLF